MSPMIDSVVRNAMILLARFLSGASVRWIDCQPDSCQRVFFANHTSHLDAVVIWAALPPANRKMTRMIAAKDYWDATRFRRYLAKRIFNALLIDRENVNIRNTPIQVMIEGMQDEYSIIMFPEGGRTSGETVAEFKSGLFYLCKKRPDLELVPVWLDNMNRILPRGQTLPVPMLSRVVFGPPMWLEQEENKEDFLKRAREAVLKLKDA